MELAAMIGHGRTYQRLNLDWSDPATRRAYNAEKMRFYRRAGLPFMASARIFGIPIGKRWQDVATSFLRNSFR